MINLVLITSVTFWIAVGNQYWYTIAFYTVTYIRILICMFNVYVTRTTQTHAHPYPVSSVEVHVSVKVKLRWYQMSRAMTRWLYPALDKTIKDN